MRRSDLTQLLFCLMRIAGLASLRTRPAFRHGRALGGQFLLVAILVTLPRLSDAQTWTYSNTDAGRPVRVEDASALPRYVLDAYLTPALLVNGDAGNTQWSLRPGFTYGLVPRTQIELSVPLGNGMRDGGIGVAGVQLAAQYGLNIETRTLPAIAFEAGMLAPIGTAGIANAHPSVKALVTRTHDWGRVHFNAETMFGDEPIDSVRGEAPVASLARWMTGAAVDRSFARKAILATAEILARQPLDSAETVQWQVGAGLRYHLTPTTLLEVGVSGAVSGPVRAVLLSAGLSRTMAINALFPGLGRWGRR